MADSSLSHFVLSHKDKFGWSSRTFNWHICNRGNNSASVKIPEPVSKLQSALKAVVCKNLFTFFQAFCKTLWFFKIVLCASSDDKPIVMNISALCCCDCIFLGIYFFRLIHNQSNTVVQQPLNRPYNVFRLLKIPYNKRVCRLIVMF